MSQASPSLPADDEPMRVQRVCSRDKNQHLQQINKAVAAHRLTGGGATVEPSSDASSRKSSRTSSDTEATHGSGTLVTS